MKLYKFALAAVAVIVAAGLCAQAAGIVGTTTQFSKMNISLIVGTNGPVTTNNNYTIERFKKTTINNRQLLAMFAGWSGNSLSNWLSAGAQWIFDWNTYQAAIADKTGTNILFYAGSSSGGVNNGTVTAYMDVDWFNQLGPANLTKANTDPGSETFNDDFDQGYFHLYYNDSSDPSSTDDLGAYGPKTETYYDHWDSGGNYLSWTDSEFFNFAGAGETFKGENYCAVGGQITASGKGSGHNDYIFTNIIGP